MLSSEFEEIYSRFYLRVTDYDIAGMSEDIVSEMLYGYMRNALAKPMVRRIFSSVFVDADNEDIEYELRKPLDDESDKDFVDEVLAVGMTVAWIEPKYHSTLNTAQFFSNKEQSWYSQANHMQQLKEMYEKAQADLRKLIRDRGYSLSVINGVESS